MGAHATHRPGTVEHCAECDALVYEPGWYAALVSVVNEKTIILPDPAPRT